MQESAGITEEELLEIEQAERAAKLPFSQSMWRDQILQARATADLDELASNALDELAKRISPSWLREQAQYPFRLDTSFLRNPVHIVNGVRVDAKRSNSGQNRFAQMLLLCEDHLEKRIDLDFFSASLFIPELAVLGNSLEEIKNLGPEAIRKLQELQRFPPDLVSSTIFELLVGSACIAKGIRAELLPETKDSKVPDIRLHSFGGVPAVIECKRRLGLGEYELREASTVQKLYDSFAEVFRSRGIYGAVEVDFREEVEGISVDSFLDAVSEGLRTGRSQKQWGYLEFRELPHMRSIPYTRIYSQNFLEAAYGWRAYEENWDGIICEMRPPTSFGVELVRNPLCLKWRSTSGNAVLKKARGITSLWHRAVKQIPPGEVGFIYIAYPEGARTELADARTKHIIETYRR